MIIPKVPHIPRRYIKSHWGKLLSGLVLSICFIILTRAYHGPHGRWYWNYAVSIHPALAYYDIGGDWSEPTEPPRFIPEIFNAPWMGTFDLPELSPPTYENGSLTSPAILKLQIFSTVYAKAWEKRRLIRKHSPLLNLPPEYRHLVEVKFVLGHAYKEDWAVDTELEALLAEEQRLYGDLIRLDLEYGENLRAGKILEWMLAAGSGADGGRPGWYTFKCDDDTVLNLPVFLDSLLALNASKPIYLGTSLVRWPSYHHHFTGMLTGFSWPLLQTLAAGISKMSHQEIIAWWDDDVLTGEIMFNLPSGPQCTDTTTTEPLPAFCDHTRPPPWGWKSSPPAVDPRTGLIRHDYLRRLGDPAVWFTKGDVAMHSWWFKFPDHWEREWKAKIEGLMWEPPAWLHKYAAVDERQ